MLRESPAYSGFAVPDIEAARTFYGDVLGLSVSTAGMGMLQIDIAGGRPVLVYPKSDFTPATFTILNFPVDDIDAVVSGLAGKGVEFQRYDGFDQDELGIARGQGPAIAWFTDPAGNILSVLEEPAG